MNACSREKVNVDLRPPIGVLILDLFYLCIRIPLFLVQENNMASSTDASDKKVLTMAEVKDLAANKEKCIMVINNRVYDVTKFIDEVCT